jgi:murein L,D-transpeptidase YcbB/YkuD
MRAVTIKWFARYLLLSLLVTAPFVTAFCIHRSSMPTTRRPSRLSASSSSDEELSPKQSQEIIMENVCRKGADKIRALDISERTKRALLAETIEDYIFEMTDELEQLFASNKIERAVDLAKQVKRLQVQYQELVSGQPSPLLESLKSLGRNDEEP